MKWRLVGLNGEVETHSRVGTVSAHFQQEIEALETSEGQGNPTVQRQPAVLQGWQSGGNLAKQDTFEYQPWRITAWAVSQLLGV
jgi:hypothetical protein